VKSVQRCWYSSLHAEKNIRSGEFSISGKENMSIAFVVRSANLRVLSHQVRKSKFVETIICIGSDTSSNKFVEFCN
jgi:hypothetical protein